MTAANAILVRPFETRDYADLSALRRAIHPDAPWTAAEIEREDRTLPEKYAWERVIAEVDGVFAGAALYDQNPGMYHPRVFQVDVAVLPRFRGRGVGARLYDAMRARLERKRAKKLLGRLRDDDPVAWKFATRRGFAVTKRDVNSVLDLQRFDPAPWRPAVERVLADGLRLVDLDAVRRDPALVRAYYEQFSIVRADAPRSLPATPVEFDFFVAEVVDGPDAVPEATLLAFDGDRCVALTQVYGSEGTPELQTGLTGVSRSHRRRGLAIALKARSLEAAKATGAPRIRTDNDASNVGMLAVNERLGFERRPGSITVAWEAQEPS